MSGRPQALLATLMVASALSVPHFPSLAAQARTPAVHAGESLRISVLTFGQGDPVYERFGHNALRVRDLITGEDLAYNWGMFSFDEPGFLRRFLSGDTRYWVDTFPSVGLIRYYQSVDRHTVEQVLHLTPAQRLQVAEFVRANLQQENKYYRYDYFRDNCSTRLRDVLDLALGGTLKTGASALRTPYTYRSESVRLTAGTPLAQAGIDLALGPKADVPLTAWESMFIPMRLRDYLRTVTVPTADGGTQPLVADERVIYEARRVAELPERRGLVVGPWGPLLATWFLLLATPVVRRRNLQWISAGVAAGWYGIVGVLGLLLAGMWAGSAHVYWYQNWNLLIASPLALVAAVPVATAIVRGNASRVSDIAAFGIGGLALFGALLAPLVSQVMGSVVLLLGLPMLAQTVAYWVHTRTRAAA